VTARGLARWLACALALGLGALAGAQAPEAGDALGAGLTPPTAARYADPAWYDLLDVRWANGADGSLSLVFELAAIDPEAPLLQPIVEAYLLQPEATARAALPGTGLETPDDVGWAVAVRLAGSGAWAWSAGPDAPLAARPLTFEVVGRTVLLPWPSDLPVEGAWVAVSGVYDPFAETGWRPFASEPSPWAFAGPAATAPVVSVIPGDDDALLRLHATARLPRVDATAPLGRISPWWWWMGAGMVLVVGGLAWRGRPQPAAPSAPTGPPTSREPDALIGDDDVVVPSDGMAVANDDQGDAPQSEGAERSDATATPTSDAGAAPAVDDDASSSRTTRAPSPASRSAKRS
jgi:hypothetical protein